MKDWVRVLFVLGLLLGAIAFAIIFFNPDVSDNPYRIKAILLCGLLFWAVFGAAAVANSAVDFDTLKNLPPPGSPEKDFEQRVLSQMGQKPAAR